MKLSNYALDNFVAPRLSELTKISACEINGECGWLNIFILNSTFRVKIEEPFRKYIFNFLLRVEAAIQEYNNGRNMLEEFLNGNNEVISKYFKAVHYFEMAVANTFQAYMLVQNMAGGKKFFDKKDNTDNAPIKRLNYIYNQTKHVNDKIANGKVPKNATIPVWLTNEGLACKEADITFKEFEDLLIEFSNIADYLSKIKFAEKPIEK